MSMPRGHTYKVIECCTVGCVDLIAVKNKTGYCRRCYSRINASNMRTKYKKLKQSNLKSKKCGGCNRLLNVTHFTKDSTLKDGFSCYCKKCKREADIKSRYKLDSTTYNNLLKSQNNKCAICATSSPGNGNHSETFSVDHCHINGNVRGLLCNKCNRALGLFGDNIKTLKCAVKYLEKLCL